MTASGALAADLSAKKPSPVEFVKACYNPLWGTSGGFTIPGTQTCLRVGGQARFDYQYNQTFQRNAQVSGFRGGGNIFLDAITPSEFGNVRAFIQYAQLFRTGNQRSGSNSRFGQSIDVNGAGTGSGGNAGVGGFGVPGATDFANSTGFIQFAGFTFGRTTSFFHTVGRSPEVIGHLAGSFINNINQAAYTARLGNGFIATIAIEDPTQRRNGISTVNAAGSVLTGSVNAGSRLPNLVGALRLDQAWGSAEISGLVTEVRAGNLTAGFPLGTELASSKAGFAVSGGLKLNVPQISPGDALFLGAVYSDGNTSSVSGSPFGRSIAATTVGGVVINVPDAVISPLTGDLRTTRIYGFNAGFQHFWRPTFATTISGSYGEVKVPLTNNAIGDVRYASVALLNSYTPVRGLQFAVESHYIYVDPRGRQVDLNRGAPFTKSDDSIFRTRLRITRDF
ncbi:MAG: porin [Beijerinckiaceae bacterium]